MGIRWYAVVAWTATVTWFLTVFILGERMLAGALLWSYLSSETSGGIWLSRGYAPIGMVGITVFFGVFSMVNYWAILYANFQRPYRLRLSGRVAWFERRFAWAAAHAKEWAHEIAVPSDRLGWRERHPLGFVLWLGFVGNGLFVPAIIFAKAERINPYVTLLLLSTGVALKNLLWDTGFIAVGHVEALRHNMYLVSAAVWVFLVATEIKRKYSARRAKTTSGISLPAPIFEPED